MRAHRRYNKYKRIWGLSYESARSVFMMLIVLLIIFIVNRKEVDTDLSPCGTGGCYVPSKVFAETRTPKTIDELIEYYSYKFGRTEWEKLTIKVKLHYLLLRESAYNNTKSCGDSGKACGPLQFHEPTYIGFRKIMIARGLVTEMGSRLDLEDAIETTAWALADGRENNWGPILRGEIKI